MIDLLTGIDGITAIALIGLAVAAPFAAITGGLAFRERRRVRASVIRALGDFQI